LSDKGSQYFLSSPQFRIAISATFTADPIQPVLAFWGRQLAPDFDIRFAPYSQVHRTLLDPQSEFARNRHGVNVVLVRVEDLGQFSGWNQEIRAAIESNLHLLLGALRESPERFQVPLIFSLCPPSDEALGAPGGAEWLEKMHALTEQFLDEVPGVHVLEFAELQQTYPVKKWNDPHADRLGHIPYTEEFFCALGTAIARLAHALFMPPYKVLVFDCDNTLWRGVCGEDGPEGVVLDEAHRALHEFALRQRDEGALLAMASKNNEQDVLDTFAAHPEMPLRPEHFVAWRINWDPKARNLVEISEELSLGLDSFIFIDDNPRECAEVADALPEVLSLTLPEPERIPHFLKHVWAFDRPVVTEEDRRRNAYYTQAQEFGRELKKAESFESFLASLQLEVHLRPPEAAEMPRVSQLTQRTNQFNFTTIRRTETEIQRLLQDPSYNCLAARVTDRFGDYGLVGVVITRDTEQIAEIDTFLLSCRVLGRGVEHRILTEVARAAKERGRKSVRLRWVPTAKNLPARQFLESILHRAIDSAGEFTTAVPVEQLIELKYKPAAIPAPAPQTETGAKKLAPRKFIDFGKIARDLSTTSQILEAVRRERAAVRGPAAEGELMSETESRLAVIWRELLETATVSRRDNFFDIGGHSLLAVLMIVRVKEAFGVELPVEDVYSPAMTLADLARKIEEYRLSHINPDEYADLLAEIEQMSDEEVRRLLEQEGTEAQA
jgi:FkbH-like protein